MTKPMYCPFRSRAKTWLDFIFFQSDEAECTPDCAWAAKDDEEYWCAMICTTSYNINTRPLKDDNDEH